MKSLLIAIFTLSTVAVSAQSFKDSFDSNSLGWTETSSKQGEAVIAEGTMHLVGKNSGGATMFGYKAPSFIETHCYSTLDISKNFEIKCDAVAKTISDDGAFGIILDYHDNGNFIVFMVGKEAAYLQRFSDGELIGTIQNQFKHSDKKKAELTLSIKSTYQKLEFFVNGMKAIEARYLPMTSNGFGFYVFGEQTIDFDNLEFIQ